MPVVKKDLYLAKCLEELNEEKVIKASPESRDLDK